MMGHRQVEQAALFYEFSLDKHIPADHLLRSIDRFVELGKVRRELTPFYSSTGRPSVDPELMIRMLDHRLLLRHPFGAAAVRRGSSQSGLPVVLPARARWPSAGSLDLLQEPARPLPPERSVAVRLRDGAAALYQGRSGRRRGLCGRCQLDQGRRQPTKGHRG